jgi:hypothetical protein
VHEELKKRSAIHAPFAGQYEAGSLQTSHPAVHLGQAQFQATGQSLVVCPGCLGQPESDRDVTRAECRLLFHETAFGVSVFRKTEDTQAQRTTQYHAWDVCRYLDGTCLTPQTRVVRRDRALNRTCTPNREWDRREHAPPMETVEWDPPRRPVGRSADPKLPFGGTWTFEIAEVPGGTSLRIREDGEIRPPIFRFMARFFFGYTRTIGTYLADLGNRFGETVQPEP